MVCQSTGRGGHGHAIHGNGERTQAAGGAAGGAHAPANAGRCGGAAGCRGPGQLVACGHRAGQRQLRHPLRSGGNRQLLHRSRHRRIDEGHVRGGVAIGGTVSDLRREIDAAEKRLALNGSRTILFVDEIHRFNRSQEATLVFMRWRTASWRWWALPLKTRFSKMNSALISRSRVVGLKGLSDGDAAQLVRPGRCRPSRAGRLVDARPGRPQRYRALGGRRWPRIAYHPRACGGHAAARHAREPCRYHEGAGGKRYAAPRIAV